MPRMASNASAYVLFGNNESDDGKAVLQTYTELSAVGDVRETVKTTK